MGKVDGRGKHPNSRRAIGRTPIPDPVVRQGSYKFTVSKQQEAALDKELAGLREYIRGIRKRLKSS